MEEYQATPIKEVRTENELKCTMGFLVALSTIMGAAIGAGVLFKAVSVVEVTGTINLHMFSWSLGDVISAHAGLAGAELTVAIPETGGMTKYIERIYGNTATFLPGWAQVVIYFPANIAASSIIFGTQFVNLFDLSQSMVIPVAVTAAVSIMLISFLGSRAGEALQSITLVCRLIPLFVIVVFGLFRQEGVDFQPLPIQAGEDLSFSSALGAGLLATMFAHDGWIRVGNISGELKRPAGDLPKAISLGIIGIIIVYLLVNAVFLKIVSIDGVVGDSNTASDVVKMIFGGFGGRLVMVGTLISAYGTINGHTFTGMRLPYVVAKGNNLSFSELFVKSHDKTKVPVATGILELVIVIGMTMVGGFDTLTDMLISVTWIFYTTVFVGVTLFRKKKPDLIRPYKAPMHPFIPLVVITGETFTISSTLTTQAFSAPMGTVLTLAGVPFYLHLKRRWQKMVWNSPETNF